MLGVVVLLLAPRLRDAVTGVAVQIVVVRRLLGERRPLVLMAAGLVFAGLGLPAAAYMDGHVAQVVVPLLWLLAGLKAVRDTPSRPAPSSASRPASSSGGREEVVGRVHEEGQVPGVAPMVRDAVATATATAKTGTHHTRTARLERI
ncbi:MAG: hypothetical protein ACJ75P_13255 [Gaiellaceae bacterium]